MNKPELCIDYYREPLNVGDFVIPCVDKVEELGIYGTITKIDYVPELNKNYLTLETEEGKTFDKIYYSRCFSTKERKDIRDNKKYVYSLICFNDEFKRIGRLPLTNIADINYNIPDDTCYITVTAEHLEEKYRETKKAKILGSYSYYYLFYLLIDDKLRLTNKEHPSGPLLVSDKVLFPQPIGTDYKEFESKEELQLFIQNLIEYFNNADLTNINNEKEFRKNKIGQKFEDDLVLRLKK